MNPRPSAGLPADVPASPALATTLAAPTRDKVAIGFVLASTLLYMLGYSVSKVLVEQHGLAPMQLTFLRCLLVLMVALPCCASGRIEGLHWNDLWSPPKAWQQRAAAAVLVVSNALAILAYSLQPVTQASALTFTAPLVLIVLGSLLLRERIALNRWLGVGLSFAGMLLVLRPGLAGGGVLNGAVFASLGGAATYAWYQTMVRRLRAEASAVGSAVQFALVGTIVLAPPMWLTWHPVSQQAWLLVLLMTVIQTSALASIAAAMRRSETSRLAPWQFSSLLWAMLMDVLVFDGHLPLTSLAGAALIVTGGLLSHGGWLRRRV